MMSFCIVLILMSPLDKIWGVFEEECHFNTTVCRMQNDVVMYLHKIKYLL